MNYPMYANNPFYLQDLQNTRDRIEAQIRQYQQTQQQPVQQPITQNFQLAPNPTNTEIEGKYANNIDEVKNTFVIKTGLFINKDFSTLWIKDVTGKIRTFNTEEVFDMDEKDKEILALKKEIQEMKGMMINESNNTDIDEPVESKKPTRVSNNKRTNAK